MAKTNPANVTARTVTENCIGFRMRQAHRVISKIYDDALRPCGLRATQLAMLAFAEERGRLRQSEMCAEFQIDDSTLSRNLERMESKGWIVQADGDDAREHPYELTAAGRKLLKQALPRWAVAQAKVEQMLGSEGVRVVRGLRQRL